MFTFMSKFSHHSIRFTVVSIVILATMVTATIAISLQYHFSKNMAKESASQIFSLSSQKTQFYLQTLDKRAQNITSMFTKFGDFVEGHQVKSSIGPVFAEMLKYNTHFYSVNIGFANGNLYELINLEASPEIRAQIGASFTDRWVTIEVSGEGSNRTRVLRYLYDDFTMRTSRKESSDYNASIRPWYVNAKEEGVSKTGPYMFQHLQSPGLSYSAKIPGSDSVLAIDIALSSIDEYLATRQESNKNSIEKEVYLFKKSGEIISSNQLSKDNVNALNLTKLSLSEAQKKLIASTPPLKVSNETNWAPISFSVSGQPKGYSVEMLSIISQMTGLQFEFINGFTWPDLKQAFNRQNIDILQPIFKTNDNIQQGIYSNPLVNIPFSIITQPNVPVFTHINQLQGKNLAIPKGWSIINIIKQAFPRINIIEYPSSKAVLEAVSQGEVFAGLDNEVIFRYTQKQFFIKNIQYHSAFDFSPANLGSSLHFMLQPSRSDLMAIINLALSKITTEQKTMLKAKWFVSSDNQAQQSTQKKQGVVPYEELIEFATHSTTYEQLVPLVINEAEHFIYLTPVNQSKTEFLAIIVPSDTIFASSNAKIKLSIIITTICLLLLLPVSWLFSSPIVTPIKLLADQNDKIKNRQYDSVQLISSNIKEIDELANSLIEMSVSIKNNELKQQELMDSFIQLIAQTIDDKSAHTGGHCKRVPELGIMLIKAVVEDKSCFKDFSFKSPDEFREFKISAWLHDCGKIITPEHIVNKGSKLETIYNRIHEIRMRFEVLWRDAEIAYYQALLLQPAQQAQLQQTCINQQQKLTQDFAFIANSNIGTEFMEENTVQRLQDIGQQTWQRHFDNTLGLSPIENLHLAQQCQQQQTLPVTESLLADKVEHIIRRDKPIVFDEGLGIKMSVPEHYANLGELYNLSIASGTLTVEDRYVINEHIISTIKMLEQLPFPPELANIPRFASTHHETLIGTGYPRKLTAEQLSIPERVLVIADIFEALTATDRPYKEAKSLDTSISILHRLAFEKHIDIDLFELFLTSGTYLTYANKYMSAKQIDMVDITKYLRT